MHEGSQYPGASPGRELMAKRPLPDDLNAQRAEQPIRSIRSSPEPSPDLQEALAVVWHRKWQILAIALLTFGVALFLSSRRTPVYESQVRLLVTPVEGVEADSPSLSPLNLATESELVSSVAVAQIVATDLNIPGPPRDLLGDLSVDNPEETEILEIGYSDSRPPASAADLDGFCPGLSPISRGDGHKGDPGVGGGHPVRDRRSDTAAPIDGTTAPGHVGNRPEPKQP